MPLTPRAQGIAPAGDKALGASSWRGSGQRDVGHMGIDDGRCGELDQHDVIVQSNPVVFGVADDLGCIDELLIPLQDFDVVLSQSHLDVADGQGRHGEALLSQQGHSSHLPEGPQASCSWAALEAWGWVCGHITWAG